MNAQGWLLQRHTGKATRTHDGVIVTLKPDLRWCRACRGRHSCRALVASIGLSAALIWDEQLGMVFDQLS